MISGYRLFIRFCKGLVASGIASGLVVKSGISWPWQIILISLLTGIMQVIEKYLKEIQKVKDENIKQTFKNL